MPKMGVALGGVWLYMLSTQVLQYLECTVHLSWMHDVPTCVQSWIPHQHQVKQEILNTN